jgi:pimeloyl-ACP methyl ester carboxylesterase/DNA-binding CsgD family transcriptional regulator
MSHPTQQIRFCTSRDGTRIAYAICGDGPPLLWIGHWVRHLKFDWESPVWQPWLALLTQRHSVIRYDWRGCGLSDREGVEFSLVKHVEDCEAVVEAASLKHFILFAAAGGGTMAMEYVVRHPDQVSHLVLYGCQTRGRMVRGMTPAQVVEAEARLKVFELGWPNVIPAYGQFFTSLHMPDATAEQFRSYNDLLRMATSPANALNLLRTYWEADVREIVPQVRCPTLVLHARQDAIIPFEEGRLVASLIPAARFVPLESRNHVLLSTEPAWRQFAEALNDFLPISATGHAALALDELTAREREVLEVVAQGLDNRGIAARLKISEKTVRNHVSIIFSKLGTNSRAQAVALARDAGLGSRNIR